MSSACSVPPAQRPAHPLPTSPQELPHPSPPSPISYEGRVSVLPPNASLQLEASSVDNSVLRFSTAPSIPLLAGRENGRSHSSEGYPHFKGVHDFVAEGNDIPLYSPPRNKNTMVFNQNMHAHNFYKLQQQQQQHLGFPNKYDSGGQERKSPPWESHQAKMVTPPRSTPSNALYNTHNTPNDSGISPGTGASISPAATGTSDEGNPQFKSGFQGKVKMEPDMEANRTESESPVSDAGHFSDERQPDDDASSRFSGYRGDPMDDDEDMEEDEIMEGHEGQASDALSRLQRALEHSGVLRSVYTGGNNDETSADDGHQAEVYQCQLCSYSGTSKFHFSAHLNTHFDLKCTQCDFTARTESKLRAHMKTSHDSMEDGEQEPGVRIPRVNAQGKVKTFKCKQCNFVAVTKLDFWEHSRTHIKAEKLLTCSKCPFVTEYKHHLEYHLRNHFGSKPFKCPKCNYSCVNKSMLNSHMKSHSNVYQYRCSDCTYATKYCHSLKLHLRKYSHKPSVVLNSDGTPNHVPVIDVYGTRRGPKKKDGSGSTSSNNSHGSGGDAPVRNSATSPAASNPPNPSPMPFLGLNPFPNLNGHPYGFPFGLLSQGYSDSLLQDKSSSLARDHKESSPARERPDTCEPLKCTLCDFVTNSRETLSQHLVRHATSENRDLASLFGIHSHHDNNSQRTESRSSRKVPSVSNPTPSPPSQPDTQMAATAPAVKEYLSRMFANPLLFAPGLTQGSMHNPLLTPRLPIKEERQTPPTPLTSPPLSPVSNRPRNSSNTTVPLDLSREGVNTPPLHAGSPQEQREKPAKNRRKGQAFKLERIAVRLQEKRSPPDSTSTSPAPQDQEEDFEKLEREDKVENKAEVQWGGAYSCGFCDIAFKDVVMYTMHMGYHGYQDPFTCNMCGQQTHDKLAFFLHIARSSHA